MPFSVKCFKDKISIIHVSQFLPVNPDRQVQVKVLAPFVHIPPLRQGFPAQSFISGEHETNLLLYISRKIGIFLRGYAKERSRRKDFARVVACNIPFLVGAGRSFFDSATM